MKLSGRDVQTELKIGVNMDLIRICQILMRSNVKFNLTNLNWPFVAFREVFEVTDSELVLLHRAI